MLLVCHDKMVCVVQNGNAVLEQHRTENTEEAGALFILMEEFQRLQARVRELEEQLTTELNAKVNQMVVLWIDVCENMP
jgi:hypothetical protein